MQIYVFRLVHSSQAVCRAAWITATDVGSINAAQMAMPLEFLSSPWHS